MVVSQPPVSQLSVSQPLLELVNGILVIAHRLAILSTLHTQHTLLDYFQLMFCFDWRVYILVTHSSVHLNNSNLGRTSKSSKNVY